MFLSLLIPGLGQLYSGERSKGIALLCISLGIGFGLGVAIAGPPAFRSKVTVVMLAVVYLLVWIPTSIDAFQQAAGNTQTLLSGDRPWYVIVMLLTVGPMALPLLWQSQRFSKMAKIIWSVLIILVALLAIMLTVFIGPAVERLLSSSPSLSLFC